jgi:membrane protein implicated in regulation of membrane protease activity
MQYSQFLYGSFTMSLMIFCWLSVAKTLYYKTFLKEYTSMSPTIGQSQYVTFGDSIKLIMRLTSTTYMLEIVNSLLEVKYQLNVSETYLHKTCISRLSPLFMF